MDETNLFFALPEGEENMALPSPALYQYYKDLDRRIIYLTDEICCENSYDLIQTIIQFNYNDRDIPPENRKPIRLIIASLGGELEPAESLVSIIELSETPIHSIAIGCVASAASLIYLACHKRYALKNAYFIFHKGSVGNVSGTFSEVQEFNKNYNKQIQEMINFYISHTGFQEEEISQNIEKDWYIRLPLALEKKVVTDIVNDIGIFL